MVKSLIDTEPGVCYWCKKRGDTALHHIYPGNPRRKYSTQDGMVVFLCPSCHEAAHNNNPYILRALQRIGEVYWLERYGTKDEFIKRYGKNYLDDDQLDLSDVWREDWRRR